MKTKNEVLMAFEKAIGEPIEPNTLTMSKDAFDMIGLQFGNEEVKAPVKMPPIAQDKTHSARYPVEQLKAILNALDRSGAHLVTFTLGQDLPLHVSTTLECVTNEGGAEATIKYWLAPNVGDEPTQAIEFKELPVLAPIVDLDKLPEPTPDQEENQNDKL